MADKIIIEPGSGDWYRRFDQAKQRAEWELGDSSWAGVIIQAFLNPDDDEYGLKVEKSDEAPTL